MGWQGARVWWGHHARQPHRTDGGARGRFRGGAGARRPHLGERESPSVGEPRPGEVGPILKEFRQPLQVQSHLGMPGILVQLGHTQRT